MREKPSPTGEHIRRLAARCQPLIQGPAYMKRFGLGKHHTKSYTMAVDGKRPTFRTHPGLATGRASREVALMQ